MFCQKCGAELTPGAVYCIKCGNKAPIIVNQTVGGNANELFSNTQEKTTESERVPDTLTGAVIDFQNGDQSAFDTIYNESKRYVYYTILKTTGDKEVADDILQETYLDVYKSLNQLQSPGAFKGWAAKIAQHKISRYYQKKSPELFSTEEEMDDAVGELTEDDMSALPEDAMINKEVQRLISEIIDELPENQKSAIVSFYYNQMSIPEIAETMGVPENTVKTYLFRGKKKIKDGILDIEKKHGTKLYALPLAGLLGLLFTEEAKAAVVTSTASQVLGAAAAAAGSAVTAGAVTTVSSAATAGSATSVSSAATAGSATSLSSAVTTGAVTTVSSTATAGSATSLSSAVTTEAVTSVSSSTTATSASVSAAMTSHSSEYVAEAVTGSGRAGKAAYKAVRAGSKAAAKGAGKTAGSTVFSSITKIFVSLIVGFSVGICTMSYVMNNTEIKEKVHEIPVIGKILDIGVKENERTIIGEWRSTADGNRMTINEDHTYIAVKADGSDPITGTWSGDETTVVFKEDLGLLGVVADTLGVNLTGVYDRDADTITLSQPKLGIGEEVYERVDPDRSYKSAPYIGRWRGEGGVLEIKDDHTAEICYDNGIEETAKWSDEGENKISIESINGKIWKEVFGEGLICEYNSSDDTLIYRGYKTEIGNATYEIVPEVFRRID